MQERDGLAQQLADAITITIQISPGSRSEVGAALGASEVEAGDEGRYTKAEADYRPSSDDARSCGSCEHFEDGSCDIVSGTIRPEDVCDYWEAD